MTRSENDYEVSNQSNREKVVIWLKMATDMVVKIKFRKILSMSNKLKSQNTFTCKF